MQNDVYDYSAAGRVSGNTVLRKTYGLLALSFIPCALGAFAASSMNFHIGGLTGLIAFFVFFYAMIFFIEKNRYSNVGAGLLMVFTFGMGALLSPLLQYSMSISGGSKLVATAALMTASIFGLMSVLAQKANFDSNALGRFLGMGAIILMIGVIANLFLNLPALSLAIAGVFVFFSSLMIMWQTRVVIEGGENSHISAALSIFISLYNLFTSLLQLLMALTGNDD
ncbi:MAG: Bax inhibitor-1 family protein [Neisseria sp.]|nr:Bax inhibitor-1 family protein [Neisseria sp.]